MKTKERPGEFYFKALILQPTTGAYTLTQEFFSSREGAQKTIDKLFPGYGYIATWPIEEIGDSILYVPSQEELEENL